MPTERTKHIEFTTGSRPPDQGYPVMKRLDISTSYWVYEIEKTMTDGERKGYSAFTGSSKLEARRISFGV